ncbi:MAG TPA: type I CRISPR-associated protein Cas7, partial [Pyrinomonadaceae bacterium]|nr:type I CRISPR-associated protein Cas7 [Pyrinomonadaceae bacterium]
HFDVRAFGGVTSTEGPLKGSFYGQIRGPLQFTFAESIDKVLQLDATITRCAVASKKEANQTQVKSQSEDAEETGNRTMGRKFLIDYGLYRAHIYFSAAFAAKTRFTYYDLDNFLFALKHLFSDDAAAGRTGMRVVGLVDFQHATCLGNAHSHKLFEKVVVERKPESKVTSEGKTKDFPSDLNDYHGSAPGELASYSSVAADDNGDPVVTARKIVWEIPEKNRAHDRS